MLISCPAFTISVMLTTTLLPTNLCTCILSYTGYIRKIQSINTKAFIYCLLPEEGIWSTRVVH